MRVRGLAVAAGVLAISSSFVRAQTTGEMLHACEMLERGMHVEGKDVYIPPSPSANQCWGFMSAVQEYATLADRGGKTLLNACPDPNGTTVQVVHIFTEYARTHPEKGNFLLSSLGSKPLSKSYGSRRPRSRRTLLVRPGASPPSGGSSGRVVKSTTSRNMAPAASGQLVTTQVAPSRNASAIGSGRTPQVPSSPRPSGR